MGSLTSTPTVPQTVSVTENSSTETSTDETLSGQDSEEIASEAREGSLLTRDRSRSGTISTSFLGVLDEEESQTQRKTLLGE